MIKYNERPPGSYYRHMLLLRIHFSTTSSYQPWARSSSLSHYLHISSHLSYHQYYLLLNLVGRSSSDRSPYALLSFVSCRIWFQSIHIAIHQVRLKSYFDDYLISAGRILDENIMIKSCSIWIGWRRICLDEMGSDCIDLKFLMSEQ